MKRTLLLPAMWAGLFVSITFGFTTSASAANLHAINIITATHAINQPPTLPNGTNQNAPRDTPELVAGPSGISDFYHADTTLYWHSFGGCNAPPASPRQPNADVPEQVARVSLTYASLWRYLYFKDLRATNSCQPYVFSRVVADTDYLYWVDATGLVKVSRNASTWDTPPVLSASFNDHQPYQIAIGNQYIYLSRDAYASCPTICFTNPSILYKIDKNTGAMTGLDCTFTILGYTCPYAFNMQVDPGERYLYYVDVSGNLQRMNLSNPTSITQLATQVHSCFPEGQRFTLCGQFLCITDLVFIGRGNTSAGQTHEIVSYNNSNGSTTNIYTSSWGDAVSINDLVSDGSEIFFFEVRADPVCNFCLQTYTAWLFRSGRGNANNLANIYQAPGVSINRTFNLDDDNVKVYWIVGGALYRLSNQASALPQSPMRVTGIEVIQSVQTTSNSTPLIRGKRTFVRVFVRSDDSTRDVPNITARVRATWTGGAGGGVGDWISPTNVLGITVKRAPSRQNLNDAFLFELPWDWVSGDNLQITAELNPAHNPEQSDNYVNNTMSVGPFHLNPSPRLEVRLFEYSYLMNGTIYRPAFAEKFGNIDWIRRAYPLDETNGDLSSVGSGLHWATTAIRDDALADRVRYPSVPCEDKDTTQKPDPKLPDCQNLRAASYVQSQISNMRDNLKMNGDTDSTSYYGLIPGGSEPRGNPPMTVNYFPRGQDSAKNAAGPAGNGFLGWYAGHEVGHSVGLGHPTTASAANECGIKGNDSLPNYLHAHIGSNDDTTNAEGFLDTPSYNSPRYNNSNLAIGSQTFDMMAYCLSEWISDQNYFRIYWYLTGNIPFRPTRAPRTNGNWIILYGGIFSGTNTATIDVLEHKIGDVTVPPITPGNYVIRLRDAGGNVLANYSFTPNTDSDSSLMLYGQAVNYVVGTRSINIVRSSDQFVLAFATISVNPPTVSNVHLVNPPNPVSGTVTLAWSGSDPDSDPLKYDVYYSSNSGASFRPLIMHTALTSLPIDTSNLGGGTGIFRVIANDGANTGVGDSASFTMPNKPPTPLITLPSANIHTHYGQVVNFSGFATDAQDGFVANGNLV